MTERDTYEVATEDDDGQLPEGFTAADFPGVDVQFEHARWSLESLERSFQTVRRSATFATATNGVVAGLVLPETDPTPLRLVAVGVAVVGVIVGAFASFPTRWKEPEPLPQWAETWDVVELKRSTTANLRSAWYANAARLKKLSGLLRAAYWALVGAAGLALVDLVITVFSGGA